MKTVILSAQDPQAIPRALSILQNDGLVAFPTDTVYGVGALAFHAAAVRSIYTAKQRSVEKAIPVLIADPVDLEKVTQAVPPAASILAGHFWPGALTLVVTKHPNLPQIISDGPTVAVRIPDHPLARSLLRSAGPLAVTSANISGLPSPSTAQEVLEQLSGRIALILDGGVTAGGVPSTVVDCMGIEPRILREGPISDREIRAVLGLDL